MGNKKFKKPRHEKAEIEEDSDVDSEVEEMDIQALARNSLKPGESLLGEGAFDRDGETAKPGSDEFNAENRGICNRPRIEERMKEIEHKTPEGASRVPWIDTLAIQDGKDFPKGVSAKDGTKLEAAFVGLAADSVKEAYRRLRVMKIPISRPPDFYAEMLRPDAQMYKVRAQAAEEDRRIKKVEDRKKSQAGKKFAKKARSKKLEARAEEKRNFQEGVAEWRQKGKLDNGGDRENIEDVLNKHGTKRGADGKETEKDRKDGKQKRNFKKEARDEKFGHGGKKRGAKRNDAKSSRDMMSHPSVKGAKGKGKSGGKKGKGGGKGKSSSKGKGGGDGQTRKARKGGKGGGKGKGK